MSDPVPESPSDLPADSATKVIRRRINWHRVRVYIWSILVIGAMWVGAAVVHVRLHPQQIVDQALAQLPYPSSTGGARWLNRRTLEIDNVKIGNFFYADAVVLTASPAGLWRHHVAKVQVIGAQLYTQELNDAMRRSNSQKSSEIDWVIGRLEISRGTVLLNNLVADTSIPVRLGVLHPISVTGLRLGAPDASPEMGEERTVEVGSVNIVSPFDPLSPVFAFPLTRVTFTYKELWHHHVRRLEMIHPTMYLGQDLFWLTNQLKAEKPTDTQGVGAPWVIAHFEVNFGQLAANAFGQPVVKFPFFFTTSVDDIRLDQLDQISVKSTVNIERLSQDYPDYKVRIANLRGKLFFSWPPTAGANNVVNTIQVDEVAWNDIPATNVSTTVTFDENGVYGRLTGGCEGGQLSGNFEFYYAKGFDWNADFFADRLNLQPIAEKLVGKYVDLTGQLNGGIEVKGKATEILKCQGKLVLPQPGRLQIKSMQELMSRLPADTLALKRDALKLAIESLEVYPYENGKLLLDYTSTGGKGSLRLDGPRGARNFEAYFHPFEAKAGRDAQQE